MSVSHGNATSANDISSCENKPDHLIVLVHGILASQSDWIYAAAKLKSRLGPNFLIYASASNSYTKTFDGIDAAGRRLADEVRNVVKNASGLTKISFISHSLGGLFARYAIALLYSSDRGKTVISKSSKLETIAGLEPVNFITLATPHLGVRGNKQLPFLFGVTILEKLAAPLAHFFIGKTGRQLFLTDGKPNKRPLLLRMASDFEDKKFLTALGEFRSRVLYANVSYDHIVGYRTSSIRRETQLLKPSRTSLNGYKHIVQVEYCPAVPSDGPHFPSEAVEAKQAAQTSHTPQITDQYHHLIEEEMIQGLQRISWKKVDVSFHDAPWPFFAHDNIHVKNEWLHNAGASVISHVADVIKQNESRTFHFANL